MARNFVKTNGDWLKHAGSAVTAQPLTMACWAKPNDTGTRNTCLAINLQSPSDAFDLSFNSATDNFFAEVEDSLSGGMITPTPFAGFGVWQHVAGVWPDTTHCYSYVDGVEETSGLGTSGLPAVVSPEIVVGDMHGLNNNFDGDIAEVAIWNIALSATEIGYLASGLSPHLVRPASLVYYWKLLGDDSPELDEVSGEALVVTGTTKSTHPTIDYTGVLFDKIDEVSADDNDYLLSASDQAVVGLTDIDPLLGGDVTLVVRHQLINGTPVILQAYVEDAAP